METSPTLSHSAKLFTTIIGTRTLQRTLFLDLCLPVIHNWLADGRIPLLQSFFAVVERISEVEDEEDVHDDNVFRQLLIRVLNWFYENRKEVKEKIPSSKRSRSNILFLLSFMACKLAKHETKMILDKFTILFEELRI